MIVVDVETTGTNPQKHSIISIGAIDMDAPIDQNGQFYAECRVWEGAHIEPDAMAVNGMTDEQIHDKQKPEEGEAVRQFFAWFAEKENLVLAGHNPMFDLGFLQAAAARQPQPELHIRADKAVRYERVAQVMAAAQQAGLRKIGFITEPVQ